MNGRFAGWEAELVAALQHDPDEGLAVLHERFGPWLFRYLNRITRGYLLGADLEDAYQEVLVVLCRRFREPDFQPECPFALIRGVARRQAFKALERLQRYRRWDLLLSEGRGQSTHDSSRPLEDKELVALLGRLVDGLPRRQRLVAQLVLEHCGECRLRKLFAVVAERMQVVTGQVENPVAVKSAWHAARVKLATGLRAHGYAPTEHGSG
jgi:DNA-directed RNA polymerase specialized sigma24 family protein